MPHSFSFNHIKKSFVFIDEGWIMPAWSSITRRKVKISGKPGVNVTATDIDEKNFTLPLIINSKTFETKQLFIEEMSSWLFQKKAKPLIFDRYPNRVLYAMIEGESSLEEAWEVGELTLNITCPDPYKYSTDPVTFPFVNGVATVNNQGSAPASPIFELDILEDITHLDLLLNDKYMRLGKVKPIETPSYEPITLLSTYSLTDLQGWLTASSVDNGHVAGTMTATASGIKPGSFGSIISPTSFQGPAVRRDLAEPLQDFMIETHIELLNGIGETGMIEIYCKDAFGNTVAKIGLEDRWSDLARVYGKFQVGNVGSRKVDYQRIPGPETAWNNFKGIVRISRQGELFRPYIALVDAQGKHSVVMSTYGWRDKLLQAQNPITEVVIAMRIWPTTTAANMLARTMKVFKYNSAPAGIPIILKANDKVVINCQDSSIKVNGEDRNDLKDFGAKFFEVPEGQHQIFLAPNTKATGLVRFEERFL